MISINYEGKSGEITLMNKNENAFKMKCLIKICIESLIIYKRIIQRRKNEEKLLRMLGTNT